MLAAAVPVDDAPGPHAMLPGDFRGRGGDHAAMVAKVAGLLTDPARRARAPMGARPGNSDGRRLRPGQRTPTCAGSPDREGCNEAAPLHMSDPLIAAGRLFSAVSHSFIYQSTLDRTEPQCSMASRSSYGELCVPKSSPAW